MPDPRTKAEPPRHRFATEEEMVARARALKADGLAVVPLDNPERGTHGFAAFRAPPDGHDGPWDEKMTLLEWPRFGRELTGEERKILSPEDLVAAWKEHAGHDGLRTVTDPIGRKAGLVCYCRAAEGKSVLMWVSLQILKQLPEELLDRLSSPPG